MIGVLFLFWIGLCLIYDNKVVNGTFPFKSFKELETFIYFISNVFPDETKVE